MASIRVMCDCCKKEVLAEIRENKLVIIDKRHGRRHLVVLTLEDIKALMEETMFEKLIGFSPFKS
jgi:hypothetical protein